MGKLNAFMLTFYIGNLWVMLENNRNLKYIFRIDKNISPSALSGLKT